ncbi:hypothetical protein WJX72_012536 [[Myrmecia] bisecta]|uniref:SAP domain-containing protein n=1 Tax=[Myrmecia] bisecta TaxID=41462 RepID=A0AAW1Q807_9CHLO
MGGDWAELRVIELKEELRKRGLPLTGKKAELIARLEEFEAKQATETPAKGPVPVADAEEPEVDYEEESPEPEEKPASADASKQAPKQASQSGKAPARGSSRGQKGSERSSDRVRGANQDAKEHSERDHKRAGHAEKDGKADRAEGRKRPHQEDAKAEADKAAKSAKLDSRDHAAKAEERKDSGRKRKYSPIPTPKPRAPSGSAAGDKVKEADKAPAASAAKVQRLDSGSKLGRLDSGSKASVFDRLGSGNGNGSGVLPPLEAPKSRGAPPAVGHKSKALHITGFKRPFTLQHAKAMLGATGEVDELWVSGIKDQAYVIYKTEEEAEATRQATWHAEWPAGNGGCLIPKFVKEADARAAIANQGQQAGAPLVRQSGSLVGTAAAAAAAAAREAQQFAGGLENGSAKGTPRSGHKDLLDARQSIEERRKAREQERRPSDRPDAASNAPKAVPARAAAPDPEPVEEDEPIVNLDTLFRKTKTVPFLYWLPLTDEEVAKKVAHEAAHPPKTIEAPR